MVRATRLHPNARRRANGRRAGVTLLEILVALALAGALTVCAVALATSLGATPDGPPPGTRAAGLADYHLVRDTDHSYDMTRGVGSMGGWTGWEMDIEGSMAAVLLARDLDVLPFTDTVPERLGTVIGSERDLSVHSGKWSTHYPSSLTVRDSAGGITMLPLQGGVARWAIGDTLGLWAQARVVRTQYVRVLRTGPEGQPETVVVADSTRPASPSTGRP